MKKFNKNKKTLAPNFGESARPAMATAITQYNYWVGSFGYFRVTEGREKETILSQIPDYQSGEGDYLAQFWFTEDGLYRLSPYWGKQKNGCCRWGLLNPTMTVVIKKANEERTVLPEAILGFIPWRKFKWSSGIQTPKQLVENGQRMMARLAENPDDNGAKGALKIIKAQAKLYKEGHLKLLEEE